MLLILLVTAVAAAVPGLLAYRTARATIQRDAMRMVASAANARALTLTMLLKRQNERAMGFLDLARAECGSDGAPSTRACLGASLEHFMATERAAGVRLSIDGGEEFVLGARPAPVGAFAAGQLAALRPEPARLPHYVIHARSDGLALDVAEPLEPIEELFRDRAGLGDSGETFLADAQGRFLTTPRYPSHGGESHPVGSGSAPMQRCLAGESGEMLAPDYRGAPVVHAFRAVPEVGGGCIMAHIEIDEAFAPARALEERVWVSSLLVGILTLAAAALFARRLTQPIQALGVAAGALRKGDFDAPIPARGPTELRDFAVTFAEMAQGLKASRARILDSEARNRFLADAAGVLTETLDYRAGLDMLAHLVVAQLGDFCVVDVVDDVAGHLQTTAVAHRDILQEPRSRALAEQHRPAREKTVLGVAMATSEARLFANGSHDTGDGGLADDPLMRELGATSYLVAPLVARKRTVGALTIAAFGRHLTEADLALAEELARRAAIAVDNGQLYVAAHQATRARDDVLAVVSHDLRNPLQSVGMSAAILKRRAPEGEAGEAVRKQAETIERATKRMNALIEDLLDLASLEGGRLSLQKQAEDTQRLLADAVDVLQPVAVDKDVALTAEVRGVVAPVLADRKRAYQILGNLAGNAVKFAPRGGRVSVAASQQDGFVRFSVSDNGPGIAPEDQTRVFERYWKSGTGGGTGLGLYIARQLVEVHGGRIWVESKVGQGTTFHFTLPAASPAPEQAAASE